MRSIFHKRCIRDKGEYNMNKAKMIIISATGSALKRTIPSLKNSNYCEVVAIHGRNEEKLKKACMDYSIPTYYMDVNEMLNNTEYDLIYIANPPFMHYESLKKAVETKKPIICEKPLDINYESALKIKDLLNGYNAPFMVAHHLRHQKAYEDIISIIKSNEIGDVTEVYCQWGFKLNLNATNATWKLNPILGGDGTFSDNGIHIVDFMLGIFGEPNGVFGHCIKSYSNKNYDTETAMICYSDKTITLNSSQNMPYPGNNIQIYGTNGKIESFGCIGEKSIDHLIVVNENGTKQYNFEPTNLYGNEVENFIKYHIFNEIKTFNGTTLDEALLSLKIIDLLRKSHVNKIYYDFKADF